jgi:hypothetical protein
VDIKRDRYLRVRGGKARIIDIFCVACNTLVRTYQKDGPGQLLRCYLNRIFSPPSLEKLQHDLAITEPRHMPNLVCSNCQALIGTPMRHFDERLAFRLQKGTYYSKKSEGAE